MTQATAVKTADTERPSALSIAQCRCGAVYTRAEWQALPSRRPWVELGLEIAECKCGSTICARASSPGVATTKCFSCFGDEDVSTCEGCGGHGRVVVCLGCAATMLLDEAREHGAFCAECRTSLDGVA